MQRHPYFDLWLHDDRDLGSVTGCPVAGRVTLHEWPLSCVQRITCANGQTYIYKVQAEPTVEPDFYRLARSPLLVRARLLPIDGMPPALLLEDARAPGLDELKLAPPAARSAAEAVLEGIARIQGQPPVRKDIRTPELWLAQAQLILSDVHTLVDSGAFQKVSRDMARWIAEWGRSDCILAAIEDGPSGYVHTDLSGENILVLPEGFRVIDWQRPIRGPAALDRITLHESLGLDAGKEAAPGIRQLRALLLIGWLAEAACYWYPPGAGTYDRQIARLVQELETGREP